MTAKYSVTRSVVNNVWKLSVSALDDRSWRSSGSTFQTDGPVQQQKQEAQLRSEDAWRSMLL